ncbi:MAG: hypothetical protein FJY65_07965 [Calditrichaeota bacterium]|nr:hypothetical protein [Calditrichota bacterium]
MATSKLSIKNRRLALLAVLIILIGAATLLPLPQSFTTPCLIEPTAIWFIMRDGNSQVVTGWQQNLLGTGGARTLIQFERPDIVEIILSDRLAEGTAVAKGDTIAYIHSGIGEETLLVLEAERDKALAELNALSAGERREEQAVLEQEARLTETALIENTPAYERVRDLFESGTASLAEWQAAQAQHQLLTIKLEIAKAKLTAAQAPARPEDVAVAKFEVRRLQQTLDNLRNSLQRMRIVVAPVSGLAHLGDEDGYILRLDQTDSMAAVIPIPETVAAKLDVAQPIEIKLYSESMTIRRGSVKRLEFRDVLGFSAGIIILLDNTDGRLKSGMNGTAKILLGRMTVLEALKVRVRGMV